jgi:hypothetical protein
MTFSLNKLGKVLALTESTHEGEALSALRTARSMLKENGMELSSMLRGGENSPSIDVLYLKKLLKEREQDIAHLRSEVAVLRQGLLKSEKERDRWQKLAKDTLEKLWQVAEEVEGRTVKK